MAITNICGFEIGTAGGDSEGSLTGATATIQSTTKRSGGYALQINPATTAVADCLIHGGHQGDGRLSLNVVSAATSYHRFYLNIGSLPSSLSEPIFQAYSTIPVFKFELRLTSDGNLAARDKAVVLLATGSTVLSTGTWYRIEVKVGTGVSAAWEVLIDGVSEMSGSTADLTATNNGFFRLGKVNNRNSQGYNCYFDDVAVSDSAYPGAGAVAVIRPNADGNYTAWTGVYTDVDDLVTQAGNDGTTTMWSTSTNLNAETAALESCATAGISGTINAVKTITVVQRTSASTTLIQHRSRVTSPGTADLDLTSYTTTAAFILLAAVYPVNSISGGAAWTIADVDSLEVGVEHNQSQSRQADCTLVCAMVDFTAAAVVSAVPPMPFPIKRFMMTGL